MMIEPQAGAIRVADIEELNFSVWPWDLRMQQMSRGDFRADLDFAQVNGILLTQERWSRRVFATGATPAGYFAVAGVCTEKLIKYAGVQIGCANIMTGVDGTDIEFATPDGSEHWVMLVPIPLFVAQLGDQLAAELLPRGRTFNGDPRIIRQLSSLVFRVIAKLRENRSSRANGLLLNAIQSQLLGAVTELLVSSDRNPERSTPRKRFHACRRAIRFAGQLDHPISVDELAAAAGVTRRVLELGFKESFDISPQRYLRRARLNGLHRDLRGASANGTTVTEAANRWGFVELGRTAGDFRELFGESPSATLKREGRLECLRYADLLAMPPKARESTRAEDSGRSG
jgi:AraC family ethanolamine operon transcriptional activator